MGSRRSEERWDQYVCGDGYLTRKGEGEKRHGGRTKGELGGFRRGFIGGEQGAAYVAQLIGIIDSDRGKGKT